MAKLSLGMSRRKKKLKNTQAKVPQKGISKQVVKSGKIEVKNPAKNEPSADVKKNQKTKRESSVDNSIKQSQNNRPEQTQKQSPTIATNNTIDRVTAIVRKQELGYSKFDKEQVEENIKLVPDGEQSLTATFYCMGCLRWSTEALGSPVEKQYCRRDEDKTGVVEFKVIRPHHKIKNCKYRKDSEF